MSNVTGIGSHARATVRGKTDEWITPMYVLESLGAFDLDPCAQPFDRRPWPTARRHYCLPREDRLSLPWEGRVWCNPPYGPYTERWLRRCWEHGDAVALVFARTETRAFHRWVWRSADGVLFLEGRLTFCRPDGSEGRTNAGGPSCLVAYGARNVEVLRLAVAGNLKGHFVALAREEKERTT